MNAEIIIPKNAFLQLKKHAKPSTKMSAIRITKRSVQKKRKHLAKPFTSKKFLTRRSKNVRRHTSRKCLTRRNKNVRLHTRRSVSLITIMAKSVLRFPKRNVNT